MLGMFLIKRVHTDLLLPIFTGIDNPTKKGNWIWVIVCIRENTKEPTNEVCWCNQLFRSFKNWGILRYKTFMISINNSFYLCCLLYILSKMAFNSSVGALFTVDTRYSEKILFNVKIQILYRFRENMAQVCQIWTYLQTSCWSGKQWQQFLAKSLAFHLNRWKWCTNQEKNTSNGVVET